jgi:chemotaxis protein methyltransferase CheR
MPPAKTVEAVTPEAPLVDLGLIVRDLANQGRLAEAWAACEDAIDADKLNPGLQYLGATILQELNRESEAMAALKRALYLDPNFLLAHFALGNLARRRGNAAAAKKYFKNVLALLEDYQADDILPEAEGLTAGRLREIIRATLQTGILT